MQPVTVAFFGISGAGKGTQAELLEKFLKQEDPTRPIIHPEMGDLLRAFIKGGSPFASKIGEIVMSGGLVPSFMPIHLLVKTLEENFNGSQHLILDGTCRRPDQSRAANDIVRLWGRTKLDALVFTLSKETAKKRLAGRGRPDDVTEAAVESRFKWFEEQVLPSVEELRKLGWAIHIIDGEPDIDTIHKNILSVLGLAG